MPTLPEHPTERDRERFRDLTKAMQFGLEYDRHGDDYKYDLTDLMFRLWWSVERERQLLQNLNMSQGCKLSELAQKLEKDEAELAKAMDQRDGLAAKLAELCEQKPVVKYMSRRLTPVGTKEMWGYDLVDGLSDGIMIYAGPVQMPVVADCRTCKNRGRTNGLSQESFCESCVWQLMSFRKNHYAPNSPDFEGIKMVELPKNDAAPVPAVAAPAVPDKRPKIEWGASALKTEEARKYLKAFMEAHFEDKSFSHYIDNRLPGDFAWNLARAMLQSAEVRHDDAAADLLLEGGE